MLIKTRSRGYSSNRKYIVGSGFMDSLMPALRGVGSYVVSNKDLIAKPVLGAVGTLAATGLTTGVPALLSHIVNRNRKPKNDTDTTLDPKDIEILKAILTRNDSNHNPVSNIIGSGIKSF